jgi:hypothetical protein
MRACFVLLILSAGCSIQAQKCNCPDLKVLLYDFDNSGAKPSWYNGGSVTSASYNQHQINEFVDWQHAPQFGSGGFLDFALKNSGGKIHFFTGSFHKNADGSFSATTADAYEPPSGKFDEDVDYIVTGKFTGGGDHFILKVHLEDARDRSRFAETSVQISSLEKAIEAGSQAAQQLSPLLETIRKYQHKVRDEKRIDETAISGKWQLTAERTELKTGESTEIKLKMFDCDDNSPLKHRKVKLKPNFAEGTIAPAEVETDDNGEATATFTAGNKTEEVHIIAEYNYTSVTNRDAYATECGNGLRINVHGNYSLKVEFEAQGHGDNGGKYHALVKGETEVRVKQVNDCYEIELVNGKEMQFRVEEVVFKSDQGSATYAGPQTFSSPIDVSLTDCKAPKFKIAFGSFGDAGETYSTSDGADFQSPLLYSLAMATLGSANLNRMQNDAQNIKQKADQYKGKEAEVDAAARRLNEHKNDPNYVKTPQGKADMALMNQMARSQGYDPTTIRPDSKRMKNLDNLRAMNVKQQEVNKKFTQPGYVGSAEYQNDQQELSKLKSNVNMNDLTNAIGFDANALEIEAPFTIGVPKPVDKIQKDKIKEIAGSQNGWEFGQFHVTLEKK